MPKAKEQLIVDCRIAGVTFPNPNGSSRQEYLALLIDAEDVPLKLVRDKKNKFDKNAIKIMHGAKAQLGFVPKAHAELLAPILDAKTPMSCTLKSVGQAGGGALGASIQISWKGEL